MKKTILLLTFLFMFNPESIAGNARYTIRGKCYVVLLNSEDFQAYELGTITGSSGSDCDNAYENLQNTCENRAQRLGYQGSIYKNIQITSKSSAQNSSVGISERKSNALLGLAYHSHQLSVKLDKSKSLATQVNYVPLDEKEGADCKVDRRYPQEKEPTIQSDDIQG